MATRWPTLGISPHDRDTLSHMRRNREEVSATEEIALTEPEAPLTEEERNLEGFVWAEFVDSNKRDFAESLGWDIGKQLGCGVFGCVYESSGPWVVKITRDPSEGPAWAFIDDLFADPELSHLMGGFCRVKEVARLRPDVIVARQRGRAVVVEATPEDEPNSVAPVYAIQREAASPVFDADDRYPGVVFIGERTADELFLSKEDLKVLDNDPERDFEHGFPGKMLPMSMVWALMSTPMLDPDVQLRVHDLSVLKVAITDFWQAASSYYDLSVKIAAEWDPLEVSELQADLNRLAIEIRKLTSAMAERPNGSENMFGYVLGTTLWTAFEDADFLPSDMHMFNIGWREHARIGDSTLPLTVVVSDPGKAITPWRPDIREVDLKQMLRRNGFDIDAHLKGVRANQPGSYWCTLCGEQTDRMTSCRRCEEELWAWAMQHTQRHVARRAS